MGAFQDIISRLNEDEETLFGAKEKEESQESIFTAEDLLKLDVSELPTLLEPIFPKVGMMGFAGSSDVGKSSFIRHFATAVVLGQSQFIGMKINATHKKAIYVSSEDAKESLAYLIQKLNQEYNLEPKEFGGLKFMTETDNLIQRLERELEREPVDLIVLDTFADLYGKSMNESNQVRTFLNEYSQLAQRYKCLVIVLHHTGKRTDEFAPSKHNLLGSQGFESKMRLVVELRLDRHYTQKRHFCIVKGNYLQRDFKESSFVLEMNENFHFSNTGERVPYAELGSHDNSQQKELENNVLELHKSGMKQQEIAEKLGTNQSKVSRIIKKNSV